VQLRGNEPLLSSDLAVRATSIPNEFPGERLPLQRGRSSGIADVASSNEKKNSPGAQAIIREKAQALLGARHGPDWPRVSTPPSGTNESGPPAFSGLVALKSRNQLIRIATRGSALALAQANLLRAQCQAAFPELPSRSKSSRRPATSCPPPPWRAGSCPRASSRGNRGAVLKDEADLAVHSLKDLPTELPPDSAGAVSQRPTCAMCLFNRTGVYGLSRGISKPVDHRKRDTSPR